MCTVRASWERWQLWVGVWPPASSWGRLGLRGGDVQGGEPCLGLSWAWCKTPTHRAWRVALPESRPAQTALPGPCWDALWSLATHSVAPGRSAGSLWELVRNAESRTPPPPPTESQMCVNNVSRWVLYQKHCPSSLVTSFFPSLSR